MTIFSLPQNTHLRMTLKDMPPAPPLAPSAPPPLQPPPTNTCPLTTPPPGPPPGVVVASPHIYYNMAQTYNISPFISHSLYSQYMTMYKQILELTTDSYISIIRTYHSFTIAAEKEMYPMFYDMIEILGSMNLLESFGTVPIKAAHIGINQPYYHYLNIMRSSTVPTISLADKYFYFYENIGDTMACTFQYIFYDLAIENTDIGLCNIKNYTIQFIRAVMFALKCQAEGGVCVFKISHVFYKPIVQLLYLLTGVYDKVFIVKPASSNIVEHDRYVVCKGFIGGGALNSAAAEYYTKLSNWVTTITQTISANFITNMEELLCPMSDKIPMPFLYKICDINVSLGHKQLEAMEHIIFLLKNKHKTGKIEDFKKNGYNHYLNWCKKYIAPGAGYHANT